MGDAPPDECNTSGGAVGVAITLESETMLAEIVNPSDQYVIEGEWSIICAATLFLGEGRYGLDGESDHSMPVFIFGGAQEWFEEQFQHPLTEFIKERLSEIADALDGITLGSMRDRQLFQEAMSAIDDAEKKAAFRASWDDKRRSSMNNIWRRADSISKALRNRIQRESEASA